MRTIILSIILLVVAMTYARIEQSKATQSESTFNQQLELAASTER